MPEYWYNVNTHEVEEDAMSDWSQLIGPYKNAEEAEHALRSSRPATNPGKMNSVAFRLTSKPASATIDCITCAICRMTGLLVTLTSSLKRSRSGLLEQGLGLFDIAGRNRDILVVPGAGRRKRLVAGQAGAFIDDLHDRLAIYRQRNAWRSRLSLPNGLSAAGPFPTLA